MAEVLTFCGSAFLVEQFTTAASFPTIPALSSSRSRYFFPAPAKFANPHNAYPQFLFISGEYMVLKTVVAVSHQPDQLLNSARVPEELHVLI